MKKTIVFTIILAGVLFAAGAGAAGDKSQRLDSAITIKLGGNVTIEMIRIPKGTFFMGNDKYSWAKHTVNISKDFYLGKTEVTVAQWKKALNADPSGFKAGDNYPVEHVSWNDCVKFIDRLNSINMVYGTFRMPTEAEWEYACRAGTVTDYYFGDSSIDNYCWYYDNSGCKTHPVGQKKPNAWGLYDMGGNVWEWCGDWWVGSYLTNEVTDPVELNMGVIKVFRGGAWNTYKTARESGGYYNGAGCCRSADRGGSDPSYRYDFVGLRLAMTPAE